MGFAVGFGAAAGGFHAIQASRERRSAEERVREYMNGVGEKEFFAADTQFRATFPDLPERSTQPIGDGPLASELINYTSSIGGTEFSVGSFDVSVDASESLNLMANGAAQAVGGRVESATPTTWQGLSALETVISVPDRRATVDLLIVVTPRRVYLLQVGGSTDPTDQYNKFKASFEIAL